jgi:hypothetical protein
MTLPPRSTACVACEIALGTTFVTYLGLPFCCEGCAGGGPCTCTYEDVEASHLADTDAVDHLGLAFRLARPVPHDEEPREVAPRHATPRPSRELVGAGRDLA